MNIFQKIKLKLSIESKFLLEQKWGLRKPGEAYSIPKHLLTKYLPANAVMIDCGAHVGADSIELAKIFPKGTVHSFEPVPAIYQHLKHNTRRFTSIKCHQLALSDKNGSALMNVSSGGSDASSSLLAPTGHTTDHPDVLFTESIDVTTMTLDQWAISNDIEKIDFLWLDMQGYEYKMLSASTQVLPQVLAVHTEVSLRDTYAGALLYVDLKKWMESLGFTVEDEAIPEGTDMGNVLFVRLK